MPRVSVVNIVYNQEQYIAQAIDSVLAQTVPPHEYIVVDDGSTDNTLGIVSGYAEQVEGLRYISVANRGQASAMNAGLIALGEYDGVIFLSGDDWFEPNLIEACLAHWDEGDMILPGLCPRGTAEEAAVYGLTPDVPMMPPLFDPTLEQFWERCTHWFVAVFKRHVLEVTGGLHPGLGGDCDWGMWLDALRRGYKTAYVPETFFNYRLHANSSTRTRAYSERAVYKAEMERVGFNRKMTSEEHYLKVELPEKLARVNNSLEWEWHQAAEGVHPHQAELEAGIRRFLEAKP